MTGAKAVRAGLYNTFMRRSSVYATVCIAAAYATTEMYFGATERVWANINKGVRLPSLVHQLACPPRARVLVSAG